MNEERIQAYVALIQALVACPNGEENTLYRNLVSRYFTISKLWVRFGKFLLRLIGEIY